MTDILDPKIVAGWEAGIPMKRAGQAEDVANACLFLASDLSTYVTGQVLPVDGGMV
ncbi:3-oxoacyl-[acyl-carrier-protein] reductase FabG [compost metagenome]